MVITLRSVLQVDTIDDPEGDGYVTLLRTVIAPDGGSQRRHAPMTDDDWEHLKRDACRLKWVDDPALTMASRSAGMVPLRTAEVAAPRSSSHTTAARTPRPRCSTV